MKTLIVLVLCNLAALSARSQEWRILNENQTLNDINSIVQWSNSHVIAVGAGGIIHRSDDAGATWSVVPHALTKNDLRSVAAENRHCIAVGDKGTILVSSDYGMTWKISQANAEEDFMSVSIRESSAIVVGKQSIVCRSDDYGAEWSRALHSFSDDLLDVLHISQDTALAVGNKGTLLRSVDNGVAWEKINLNIASALSSISVNNQRKICISGDTPSLLFSSDMFSTWSELKISGVSRFPFMNIIDDSLLIGVYNQYPDVAKHIYSTNLGKTWNKGVAGYGVPTQSSSVYGDFIWFCGKNGYAGKANVGALPTDVYPYLGSPLLYPRNVMAFSGAVHGFDDRNLCSASLLGDTVYMSSDKGKNWSSVPFSHQHRDMQQSPSRIVSVFSPRMSNIATLSSSSRSVTNGQLHYINTYTTVSAYSVEQKTWSHHDFPDTVRILAAGFKNNFAALHTYRTLYYSADYGATWEQLNSSVGIQTAYINGAGDIVGIAADKNGSHVLISKKTSDAQIVNLPIFGISGTIEKIVSTPSSILVLTSAFANGTRQYRLFSAPPDNLSFSETGSFSSSSVVRQMDFYDAEFGIIVCNSGTSFLTEDGGKTWKEKSYKGPASTSEAALYIADTRTAFLAADQSLFVLERIVAGTNDKNNERSPSPLRIVYGNNEIECTITPSEKGTISLALFSANGEKIKDILSQQTIVNSQQISIPTSALSSGVYLLVMSDSNSVFTEKCVLIR